MCQGQAVMGKEAQEGSWGLTRGTPIKVALESSGSNAEPQRSESLLHIPSLPPSPSVQPRGGGIRVTAAAAIHPNHGASSGQVGV